MPFTDTPWSTPRSDLSADDFCSVCLIDSNPTGQEKAKANCKLPVRSTPGGPFNKAAIRNAIARFPQMEGIAADERRKAARRLISLAKEAEIAVNSESLYRMAGMKPPGR